MEKGMDKKTIAIKIHSFVDVITNSSTELFMCNKKKSVKQVKEVLKDIVNHYNNGVKKKLYGEYGKKISIDNFIVRIYTKKEYDKHIKENTKYGDYGDWDGYGYEKKENIGKIIIKGSDDNIIPYELFDMIEDVFDADRKHLG